MLKNRKTRANSGITLIELLIALTINVILLAGVINVISLAVGHENKLSDQNQLNQQLQTVMQLMANDIRRAGYWANARTDLATGKNTNPFMATTTNLQVNSTNDCILFTYDAANNGSLPAISNTGDDDRYGYRLVGAILQARPPGATFSCTAPATEWENLLDPTRIKITNFTVTLSQHLVPNNAPAAKLAMRSVDISITGQLINDATVTKTLSQHIRVRNDQLLP